MDVERLLSTLVERGIVMRADDGNLRVEAPRGALTDDLRAAIATHKPQLLARLASEESAIDRVPRDGDLPLSFAQEALWFLQRLDPQGVAYNVAAAVSIRGPLDIEAL